MKRLHKTTPYKNTSRGFTLIEVMIASTIFVIIITTGVTILITATNNYRQTSEVRQAMDTLNFVMEDMTRNLRLGTVFHCSNNLSGITTANACPVTSGVTYTLAFEAFNGNTADPADQVVYGISSPTGSTTQGALYKKTKDAVPPAYPPLPSAYPAFSAPGAPFEQITPSNVSLDMSKSGFIVSSFVEGTSTPAITIRLVGTVAYRATQIPFSIQSTVAPRNLPQH
jgi:prepilin-type N-terminal cleavage/methylation domain-containing protein